MKKKVLITGANGGLGVSLVKKFLALDYIVIGISLNDNNISKIINKNLYIFKQDISDYYGLENVISDIYKKFNDINILINNAAVYKKSKIDDLTLEEIDRIIDVNIKGVIYTTKICLNKLLIDNSIIINIGSIASTYGIEHESIYCASKYALKGFTESLRKELFYKSIKITEIIPGGMNTPLWNNENIYNGNVNDLINVDDISEFISKISSLPSNLIVRSIVLHPLSERHQ